MHSFGWCFIFLKLEFEMMPEVFNGIQIWRLGRPFKYLNVVVLKPLLCLVGGVFGVIVLLKDPLILWYVQLFKAFHHSIIQNLIVLVSIHLPLHLYELPHPILTRRAPYHEIVASSMLDCWCCYAVRYQFPSFFPHIHLSI